jgi:muramoyltetrapeptide carboxypeptidase
LKRRGFIPVLGKHAGSLDGYLAGSDAARAADLDEAIADPTITAIWFVRGGYGTARILDRIDLARLVKKPKLLLGFSDLTALFCALLKRTSTVCLHAPGVAEMGDRRQFHAASLARALSGLPIEHRVLPKDVVRPGKARGRLLGGNLTVLTHLLGTRHMPDLRKAVVFLEEIGEEAYKVDRLLQHLRMSGALDGARAVVLGRFLVPTSQRAFPGDRAIATVLSEHLAPLGVPVIKGVPAGHGPGKWTLPLGGMATLDTAKGRLTLGSRPV